MRTLFITGSTGFIGRRLIQKIDPARYQRVYCLSRSGPAIAGSLSGHENLQFIEGDIVNTDSYAPYLASCDTVIHLAATTGKAAPEEYFGVNARGTQLLIEQCEQKGVKDFLYISTIAVKYPDKSLYYYAQSKEQGEQAVKNSRLSYAIVRPTIVIGKEAVIWKTLSRLASKPILLMLGDGTTLVQPIYVEDLIDCLLTILSEDLFCNETYELGGPEEITFERLLKRIHSFYYGREPFVLHVPIRPIVGVLNLVEKRFHSALPMSAGQLSAFSNDGTIETNKVFALSASQMKNVNSMLEQVISNE
jgi:NADH dehydrogenase